MLWLLLLFAIAAAANAIQCGLGVPKRIQASAGTWSITELSLYNHSIAIKEDRKRIVTYYTNTSISYTSFNNAEDVELANKVIALAVHDNTENQRWIPDVVMVMDNESSQPRGSHIEIQTALNKILSINDAGTVLAVRTYENTVKVFEYNNDDWVQLGADIPGASSDVGLHDTELLVAVSNATAGVVQVYAFSNDTWSVEAEFQGQRASDQYGTSISMKKNTLVVGTMLESGGYVHVMERMGEEWERTKVLSSGTRTDHYGATVATSGDFIAVGSPRYASNEYGRVYVAQKVNDDWQLIGRLQGDDIRDYLGTSVAITDHRVAAGTNANVVEYVKYADILCGDARRPTRPPSLRSPTNRPTMSPTPAPTRSPSRNASSDNNSVYLGVGIGVGGCFLLAILLTTVFVLGRQSKGREVTQPTVQAEPVEVTASDDDGGGSSSSHSANHAVATPKDTVFTGSSPSTATAAPIELAPAVYAPSYKDNVNPVRQGPRCGEGVVVAAVTAVDDSEPLVSVAAVSVDD